MRSTRWLLLLTIVAIVAAVGFKYYIQKQFQASREPRVPPSLPTQINAAARDWEWAYTDRDRPVVYIRAKNFRQLNKPSRIELEQVELHLFAKDGKHYDKVVCANAVFDPGTKNLFSDGDVEITMGMPAEGEAIGRLVFIRSSGVTFDSQTGKASTERLATFTFDRGDGHAMGAVYDPQEKELRLAGQVELLWRGDSPKTKPMKVEAGALTYKESDSHVYLMPWSRLSRENMMLNAGPATIALVDGTIRSVQAEKALGGNHEPGRDLEYSADKLDMNISPDGEIEQIVGYSNARLLSTSKDTRTQVTCDNINLGFDTASGESTLTTALASGHSVVRAEPTLLEALSVPQTRILHSDVVSMKMRPGGREIESVETHTPGYVEFLANRAGQPYRRMDGTEMWITYGTENRIQKFRSVNVTTRTVAEKKPGQKTAAVSETWSKELIADFDPKTSQLARIEQNSDFRYQEGDRKAKAVRAVLDSKQNVIWLKEKARVWDPTGSTAADEITMDQRNGDVDAKGHVASTRMPDRKGAPSAMLSQDQPMQATADHMVSTNHNQRVRYEGHAFVWQESNRVRAEKVDIDRDKKRMEASGHVYTQFVDQPKSEPGAAAKNAKAKPAPVFTTVTAQRLVYTDQNRLADYTGGAHLMRPGMDVTAAQIRAFLSDDKNADSRLERAYADGQVEILRTAPDRTRKGTADHAQYEVAEDKIVLFGGKPIFQDSVRGSTQGTKLTYFSDSDRLLVDGEPSVSRIQRKK